MGDLNQLKATLEGKFPYLAEKIVIQRALRMWVEVTPAQFREVVEHLKKQLGFAVCCTITGTDDNETLGATYHLAHDDGTVLNLRQRAPRASPVIQSVCDLYPSCANYERELVDLLGFKVENLPPGNRYPMPDSFPRDQHPLRKDWQPVK
ncbi:MAG: NADH-quinone oxidoreductase subunit C [Deltaproteobacteria bacterium]|nr:NADH-quinone oxidoreductase subunit C [Deltaproteobacteria bacterium]